jgi:peptidoglycan/LPS O-acetylase OafA/YrhL
MNNFDLLRFLAASAVIISHSVPLFGLKIPEPLAITTGHMESLGGLAVSVFFVISGYLISQSYANTQNYKHYLLKRVLRIFPALIVCVVIMLVTGGMFLTSASMAEFFHSKSAWCFLGNALLYTGCNTMPGVFTENPVAGVVNGSLWTLSVEFALYLITPLIFAFSKERVHSVFFVIVAFAVFAHVQPELSLWGGAMPLYYAIKQAIFFLIGVVLYLYREQIVYSAKGFVIAMLCVILTLKTPYFKVVIILALPYIVMYLSRIPNKFTNNFGRFGDFSYGLYIYGYFIQQILIAQVISGAFHLNFYEYLALSYVLSLIIAVVSYHLIEKQFLRLKSRLQ